MWMSAIVTERNGSRAFSDRFAGWLSVAQIRSIRAMNLAVPFIQASPRGCFPKRRVLGVVVVLGLPSVGAGLAHREWKRTRMNMRENANVKSQMNFNLTLKGILGHPLLSCLKCTV